MSEIIQKTDYLDANYNLLLGQFKDEIERPNWRGVMDILSGFAQEIEDVAADMRDKFSLITAVGDQLDILGLIVGIRRTSSDDDVFRRDIQFKIIENRSAGESEFLQNALAFLTYADYVWIKEVFPAFMSGYIQFDTLQTENNVPPDITAKMDSISGGGIKYAETHSSFGAAPFTYAYPYVAYGGIYGWDDGSGDTNIVPDAGTYSAII